MKNDYTYTFFVKDRNICDEILRKSTQNDLFKNEEMKVFLNDEEIQMEKENDLHTIEQVEQTGPDKLMNSGIDQTISNIREITVGNISDKLKNEKIYEIFFIYGDISKIEFNKKEVRS